MTTQFRLQFFYPMKSPSLFLLVLCGVGLLALWQTSFAAGPESSPPVHQQEIETVDFSSLNLRMSNRPLSPPSDLIIKTFSLEGISVARPFEGPPPQGAIIENDHRQRVAILTQNTSGTWLVHLLEPVPLDPQLPGLFQCARFRHCDSDRMPLTGGLACLAICVKEMLESAIITNHSP